MVVEGELGCGGRAWLWRESLVVEGELGCGGRAWLWRESLVVEGELGCGGRAWLWRWSLSMVVFGVYIIVECEHGSFGCVCDCGV